MPHLDAEARLGFYKNLQAYIDDFGYDVDNAAVAKEMADLKDFIGKRLADNLIDASGTKRYVWGYELYYRFDNERLPQDFKAEFDNRTDMLKSLVMKIEEEDWLCDGMEDDIQQMWDDNNTCPHMNVDYANWGIDNSTLEGLVVQAYSSDFKMKSDMFDNFKMMTVLEGSSGDPVDEYATLKWTLYKKCLTPEDTGKRRC